MKAVESKTAVKEVEPQAENKSPNAEEDVGSDNQFIELPSTGIPRLDRLLLSDFKPSDIIKICDADRTMLYVCLRLCELNTELADKLRAGLAKIVEPFQQGKYPKDFDEGMDIAPIEAWLSFLDGFEAGLTGVQNKRGESDTAKTICNPEKLLGFIPAITDDAAVACLACLDLQKANSQLAGEIRGKLWERVRPIVEDGQIPSGMDHDVAADMMRLLGIRDAVLALTN